MTKKADTFALTRSAALRSSASWSSNDLFLDLPNFSVCLWGEFLRHLLPSCSSLEGPRSSWIVKTRTETKEKKCCRKISGVLTNRLQTRFVKLKMNPN